MRTCRGNEAPDIPVDKAVSVLKSGGLVAFPTDTLYALGADCFNEEAVNRVFAVKRRPLDMPLPILLASPSDMSVVAKNIPDYVWQMAECFWPGPLTLILCKTQDLPPILVSGGKSIAVRVPNHSIALNLINSFGRPVTGTSANTHGETDPTTAVEVMADIGGSTDIIIDGGRCQLQGGSTIVDVTNDLPRIVRQGVLPARSLVSLYPDIIQASG